MSLLPPDLTKAQRYIRVRFYGSVLRCERMANGNGAFSVAVRNTTHRYLSPDEAAVFDELDKNPDPPDYQAAALSDRKAGT